MTTQLTLQFSEQMQQMQSQMDAMKAMVTKQIAFLRQDVQRELDEFKEKTEKEMEKQ